MTGFAAMLTNKKKLGNADFISCEKHTLWRGQQNIQRHASTFCVEPAFPYKPKGVPLNQIQVRNSGKGVGYGTAMVCFNLITQ